MVAGMTPIPWYAVLILVVAIVGVSWLGIRRSERFAAWKDAALSKLRRDDMPDETDETFMEQVKPDQSARDKGAG